MLTIISILLALATIYFSLDIFRDDTGGLNVEFKFLRKKPIITAALFLLSILLRGMFFYADAGTAYAVQYITGNDKMVVNQGIKLKWYGRTIPLSYEMSIKDVFPTYDDEGKLEKLAENQLGIYNRPVKNWEFADAIKAQIGVSVVAGVSIDDEEQFLKMADRNRSEAKLVHGRIIPNIDAALKNTCKLMDAQDYISGKASDFDRYFRDQLENGMYQIEEYTVEDDIPEIIGDTATARRININKNVSKQTKYRIKRDHLGEPIRDKNSNTLNQYGIKIYQANVTGIDWEKSFDNRLDLQKNEVAQIQLEKQQAEKEFYRAQKEKSKGEAEKAKERARLEKEQIQLTIAAETRAKVAIQDEIAERKITEVNFLKAKSQKILADAQAYENAKLVSAGLTPQEKAEYRLKEVDVISKNFAKMETPSIIMSGGDKSNDATSSLIQAAFAKQLLESKR